MTLQRELASAYKILRHPTPHPFPAPAEQGLWMLEHVLELPSRAAHGACRQTQQTRRCSSWSGGVSGHLEPQEGRMTVTVPSPREVT